MKRLLFKIPAYDDPEVSRGTVTRQRLKMLRQNEDRYLKIAALASRLKCPRQLQPPWSWAQNQL